MKVTSEMINMFMREGPHWGTTREDVKHGLQAVLDHLFPEPGENPLAVRAPDRDTVALRRLRNVLVQADHSESALRGQGRALMPYHVEDPESAEILTTVANVRRLLSPWGLRDWESLNHGR